MAGDIIKEDAPYADFARRLRKLRTDAGLSRKDMAEKIGVVARTIINYENGTRIPYADTAVKMAQLFGISVDALLGMEDPEMEMARAEALDKMRNINGKKGADRLNYHLNAIGNEFAGGELSVDQMEEYVLEMQKMALLAQQKLRELHTNKRFQATVEAKAAQTAEAVKAIDQALCSLVSEKN